MLYQVFLSLNFIFSTSFLSAAFNQESAKSIIDLTSSPGSLNLCTPLTAVEGKIDLRLSSGILTQNLAADTLSFSGGSLGLADAGSLVSAQRFASSGTFTPGASVALSKLVLDNGQLLDLTGTGTMPFAVQIGSGTGTPTARVVGESYFAQTIDVRAGATLELGLKDTLYSDIQMTATSTLKLLSDLVLGDSVQIRPTVAGTACQISLNGCKLALSGTQQTDIGGLKFITTTGAIALRAGCKLSGPWQFATAGDFYIRGNSNVLDCSKVDGAALRATVAGVNLYLDSVHIILAPGIPFADLVNTFNIKLLHDVTFELTGDVLLNAGATSVLQVLGDNNRFLIKNYKFEIGNGWTLNLAANKFLDYELEQKLSFGQIFSSGSGSITFGSGAALRQTQSLMSVTNSDTLPRAIAANISLVRDHCLSAAAGMYFFNPNVSTPKTITVDGGGNAIVFNAGAKQNFYLDPNVQLTLQNVVLKNFNPSVIGFGAATATLSLGDNVRIELDSDVTIPSDGLAWQFIGNAEIDGFGHTLTITADNLITLTGAKILTFSNIILKPQTASAFKNLTPNAKIVLKNSRFLIPQTFFTFATGDFEIQEQCKFYSRSQITSAQTVAQSKIEAQKLGFTLFGSTGGFSGNVTFQIIEGAQATVLGLSTANKYYPSINYASSGDVGWGLYTLPANVFAASGGAAGYNSNFYPTYGTAMAITGYGVSTAGTFQDSSGFNGPWTIAGTPAAPRAYAVAQGYNAADPFAPTSIRYYSSLTTYATVTEAANFRKIFNTGVPIASTTDATLFWIETTGEIKKMVGGPGGPINVIDSGFGKTWRDLFCIGSDNDNYFLAIDNTAGELFYSRSGSALKSTGIKNVYRAYSSGVGSVSITFADFTTAYRLGEALFIDELIFDFTSTGTFKIKAGAALILDENAAIRYNPSPANDAGITANTKRHFVLEDINSTIKLEGGSFISTATGLALDRGRLLVAGACNIYSNASAGAAVELGSALSVEVDSYANLNFQGPVEYKKTTVS